MHIALIVYQVGGGEILDKREILRSNLNINGAKAFEYEGKLIFYPPHLILTFIHKYQGGRGLLPQPCLRACLYSLILFG